MSPETKAEAKVQERTDKVTKREVSVDTVAGGAVTTASDANLINQLVKKGGNDYLPRLQLQTANSKDCKSGAFPVNHFAIVQDQTLMDVGTSVDVLVYASRMQALDFSDDSNVISAHDPELDAEGNFGGTFAEIVERSKESDSKCMWGAQYLVYVPSQRTFATMLFGTKTSRRDAPAMSSKLGKAATIGTKKIPSKKYGDYFSMAVLNCSEALDAPAQDAVDAEIKKFANPPKRVVETVEVKGEQQAR